MRERHRGSSRFPDLVDGLEGGDVSATVLAYVDAVPGRLYPLVATLLELAQRGHRVAVRCGMDDVERLRALGLDAKPLMREIERFEPSDWKARTRFGALSAGLGQFGERTPFQLRDLQQAIEAEQPDVLFVDEGAWGAAVAAEHSGLPWAYSIVSPVPLPSRDAPPFGLGLAPRRDRLGHLRDRLVRPLTLGTLERVIAKHVNPLRAELGLRSVATISDAYLAATVVLAYTAEPFEYPRSDWPAKLRLVGPGLWEPPADPPDWLDELKQPLVLVTCSTLFHSRQSEDRRPRTPLNDSSARSGRSRRAALPSTATCEAALQRAVCRAAAPRLPANPGFPRCLRWQAGLRWKGSEGGERHAY
jgi:UDP:flavonoid glycosyltransferase YjiC (YdhE family)